MGTPSVPGEQAVAECSVLTDGGRSGRPGASPSVERRHIATAGVGCASRCGRRGPTAIQPLTTNRWQRTQLRLRGNDCRPPLVQPLRQLAAHHGQPVLQHCGTALIEPDLVHRPWHPGSPGTASPPTAPAAAPHPTSPQTPAPVPCSTARIHPAHIRAFIQRLRIRPLVLPPGRRVPDTVEDRPGQIIQPVPRTGLDPGHQLIDPPMPTPQPPGSLIPSGRDITQCDRNAHTRTVPPASDSTPPPIPPIRPTRPAPPAPRRWPPAASQRARSSSHLRTTQRHQHADLHTRQPQSHSRRPPQTDPAES